MRNEIKSNEEIDRSVRDADGLQDAEEEYGWTVKRDINGDGDATDNIYYDGVLYYKEHLDPRGEGGEVWSYWNNVDSDGDGVYDRWEKYHHTHPMVSDTDHDGLSDHYELNTWFDKGLGDGSIGHTDPHMADTDMDGFSDYEEIHVMDTNPINYMKFAILIQGGKAPNEEDINTYAFRNSLKYAYKTLISNNYQKNKIFLLSPETDMDIDGDGYTDVIAYSTKNNIEKYIKIISYNSDADDKVFIFLTGHGDSGGKFYTYNNQDILYDYELASWINQIKYSNLSIIIDTCFSGAFIDDLSGLNRIIITSTDGSHPSYCQIPVDGYVSPPTGVGVYHSFFCEDFFYSLSQKRSLSESFINAYRTVKYAVETMRNLGYELEYDEDQIPLIDDNGDHVGNPCSSDGGEYTLPNGGDGHFASKIYL